MEEIWKRKELLEAMQAAALSIGDFERFDELEPMLADVNALLRYAKSRDSTPDEVYAAVMLARRARALLVGFEGLHTYGGMSGRDMEALARGIYEMVETDDHVRSRVGQVEYLGNALIKNSVPITVISK